LVAHAALFGPVAFDHLIGEIGNVFGGHDDRTVFELWPLESKITPALVRGAETFKNCTIFPTRAERFLAAASLISFSFWPAGFSFAPGKALRMRFIFTQAKRNCSEPEMSARYFRAHGSDSD